MKAEWIGPVKIFRWRYRRVLARLRHGAALEHTPILLGNSFPKSGTHLLTQVLQAFARFGPAVDSGLPAILTFDGPTGRLRHESQILKVLRRLRPGDIAYGHLHATPQVSSLVCDGHFAPYFIYRDPRDVVVSHVHYVTDMAPNHVHHNYYKNFLKDFDERLTVSILGRPEMDISFPNILDRFLPYINWTKKKGVLAIKFEDFIHQQETTLKRVYDHAIQNGYVPNIHRDEALKMMQTSINPQNSPTYRSGIPGKWHSAFSNEHKKLFKELTGNLLIELGYEESNDW